MEFVVMENEFSALIVATNVTLRDVLAALDRNGKGVVILSIEIRS